MRLTSAVLFCGTLFQPSMLSRAILVIKTIFFATLFVWVRATIPRIRYDHLIYLTWKNFLPVTIGLITIILAITTII
jgi:NADH:ubiquinone oxidoreductase subunit H